MLISIEGLERQREEKRPQERRPDSAGFAAGHGVRCVPHSSSGLLTMAPVGSCALICLHT